jgi:protein-arginine kinase activator protein McsA
MAVEICPEIRAWSFRVECPHCGDVSEYEEDFAVDQSVHSCAECYEPFRVRVSLVFKVEKVE